MARLVQHVHTEVSVNSVINRSQNELYGNTVLVCQSKDDRTFHLMHYFACKIAINQL